MKISFLVVFIATIISCDLLGAEPSAFGAGDLSNPSPYGLTSKEKVILQNKKNLHNVVAKSNDQANKVDSLRERLDGLQTIVEGLSQKSHKNKWDIKKLDEKNLQQIKNSNEYEKRLSEVSQLNSEIIQSNKVVISELSLLLNTINSTYITKDEFNVLVNDVNTFKELVAKELKKLSTPKKSSLNDMSMAEITKKARAFYDKKYYTKSIEYYTYLVEKNYKPARAHYMIGEMQYYRKNYGEAIAYFKKSAKLYPKASYMPILMLHTAISMEKTGDTKNAKSFYNGIILKYPESKYAVDAIKHLETLK